MKISKLIYSFLVFAIVLSACEGEEVAIDAMIKNKENPVEYVIEGQITNIAKKQHVFISKPGGISKVSDYKGIHNATVTITDGKNSWNFKELSVESKKYRDLYLSGAPYLTDGGVYESDTYFAGKAGETYTLKVIINGEVFTAQETMPVAENITDEEFASLQGSTEFTTFIFGAKKNAIWSSATAQQISNSLLNRENVKMLILGRMNSFKQYHSDVFDTKTSLGHILKLNDDENKFNTLRRYSITDKFSNYIWSYAFGRGGSVLAIEPNTHPSNFNNKKITGYFSAINCSQYQATYNTYYPELISYWSATKTFTANYSKKGGFKLITNADGSCELNGLNEKLMGAYDIINGKQLNVYFSREYAKPYEGVYHFYEIILKKALSFYKEKPEDNISYWSGYNAIFDIQPDGSLKSVDGKIWK